MSREQGQSRRRRTRRRTRQHEVPEGIVTTPTIIPEFPIEDVKPYEFNPRLNEKAVPKVKKSIEDFGFLVPIVIKSDGELAAGHTRLEAARQLGLTHVPAVLADHLTDDQLRAFRLIDNKVAEESVWDFDLLGYEMNALTSAGFDLSDYWAQEEIDCLTDVVADDCLGAGEAATEAVQSDRTQSGSRAPERTRIVVGEFVFHVPRDAYRMWSNALKEENDFEEARIIEDLQARLGITQYLS